VSRRGAVAHVVSAIGGIEAGAPVLVEVNVAYWMLKEEPSHYSFEDLLREKETIWDGITNALALKHLRTAKKGDLALIYHTGDVRAAVGLARLSSDPFPDPAADDPKLTVVSVRAGKRLPTPVTLEAMRKNPRLAGFDLLRISRLSFVPVSETHWNEILAMAGTSR
jgi:predicted RNA-binding protein with PUA-like domain